MSTKIVWRCPSNIALVKYWGKKENQIPCNASLSMTLQNAYTEVALSLHEKKEKGIELEYLFHDQENETFRQRVLKYLDTCQEYFPVLKEYSVHLASNNSFPHSTGIASSASAFGAIALALLSASGYDKEDFYKKASYLSRLGSGSACRSMFEKYALWGELQEITVSSDEYAIPVPGIHSNFKDMRDAILIIDDMPKKVSSSSGHALMHDHWYAEKRFEQANIHCAEMAHTLKQGDFDRFITIIEQEALALHAMMMTSGNYYLLMKPGTIHAIESIMNFRKETNIPVCFTLDAGPNVHVIYSGRDEDMVNTFLESELKSSTKGIIYDRIGNGPEKLMS